MCKEPTQERGTAVAQKSATDMKENVQKAPTVPAPVCLYRFRAKLCSNEPSKKKKNNAVMAKGDVSKKKCRQEVAAEVHAIVEQAPGSVCARPECAKGSWNGSPGEYCSKACKRAVQEEDARNAEEELLQEEEKEDDLMQKNDVTPPKKKKKNAVIAQDAVPNDNSGKKAATDMHTIVEKAPLSPASVCLRPECTKGSWNGGPREYCSKTCKRAVQEEHARKAEEELLQEDEGDRKQKNHVTLPKKKKKKSGKVAKGKAVAEKDVVKGRQTEEVIADKSEVQAKSDQLANDVTHKLGKNKQKGKTACGKVEKDLPKANDNAEKVVRGHEFALMLKAEDVGVMVTVKNSFVEFTSLRRASGMKRSMSDSCLHYSSGVEDCFQKATEQLDDFMDDTTAISSDPHPETSHHI